MCDIHIHTHVHTKSYYQLSLSSDYFNFPAKEWLLSASLYLLFTLPFISTYIFQIFLCFFLNRASTGKSPVPCEQWSEFLTCQTIGPREEQEHSRSQGFICQNTLGSLLGLMCRKCEGLESSCLNRVGGSLIFCSNVLHGKKFLVID